MPSKWFAAALGFFFQPLAFVYLAQLSWALVYFLLAIVVAVFEAYSMRPSGYSGIGLVFAIFCAVHAFRKAKETDFDRGKMWYNHWWGVMAIPLVFIAKEL